MLSVAMGRRSERPLSSIETQSEFRHLINRFVIIIFSPRASRSISLKVVVLVLVLVLVLLLVLVIHYKFVRTLYRD